MKERFPAMVRISERTFEIRTKLNGDSGRVGVKGRDERQSTAPLTPTRPPREAVRTFQLTGVQAVIHGARDCRGGTAGICFVLMCRRVWGLCGRSSPL